MKSSMRQSRDFHWTMCFDTLSTLYLQGYTSSPANARTHLLALHPSILCDHRSICILLKRFSAAERGRLTAGQIHHTHTFIPPIPSTLLPLHPPGILGYRLDGESASHQVPTSRRRRRRRSTPRMKKKTHTKQYRAKSHPKTAET